MLKQLWQGYTAFSSLNLLKQMSNKGKIKLEINPKLGRYKYNLYNLNIRPDSIFSAMLISSQKLLWHKTINIYIIKDFLMNVTLNSLLI